VQLLQVLPLLSNGRLKFRQGGSQMRAEINIKVIRLSQVEFTALLCISTWDNAHALGFRQ
jgi:hypothetical protein